MPAPTTSTLTTAATPTVNPGAAIGSQVSSITQRIPGIRRLPHDVQPIVLGVLDLICLYLLFQILRRAIDISIRKWTNNIADKEEKSGNLSRAARLRTLTGLTTSIVVYTVGAILLLAALGIVGVNTAALLSTVGIAGIAFGFGAQKVAKDVITGFIILFEDQYAVGEYVTINAVTGTVEELAMRTTHIRDDDGKLFILSNGDIAQVCNQSRGPVSGSFDISVAAGADISKATEVLNEALAKASEDLVLAQAAHVAGITQADAAKTTFKITFRTGPTVRPGSVTLKLRDAARTAIVQADIPLGPA